MSASRRSDDLERARGQWTHRGDGRPTWAIEPKPGQESVWDYPRPPTLDPDSRLVRVVFTNMVIAETGRSIRVLETASPPTFYIPPDDVRTELLMPGRGASQCEWKGTASYWSLRIDPNEITNVAWSYEDPNPEFTMIRGYLGFYPSKVQCYVDGNRVAPQPGGFYGGWVTEEIVGPFKGEPGTGGW
ncbi:MAG: DUF427 domain-containing protein [Myxococcales bacterium]|nr:DUF427 domain-containing protein [Myxococcales bacterium]MDH3483015.1 DUF427 domain-containing protein [Myxococcales bacterium]